MLATQVVLCVTIIGDAALFLVILNERSSLIRTVFAIYVAFVAGWAFSIYLNLFLKSLLVESWIFGIAAGVLTIQLWFAIILPYGDAPKRVRTYVVLAIGYFFMLASFYPGALFNVITVHPEGYTILDNGFLSAEYSLFALIYVFSPIIILFRKYRIAREETLRRQLRSLTIGFSLFAAIAVLTNSALPVFFHLYTFNAIGPAFSLIFAAFVFYNIGRYEFLDIRAAVQRGVIYSFLIAIIVIMYEGLLMLVDRDFSLRSDFATQLSAATVTVAGILTIPIIERHFQKVTDRVFFKDRYDYALSLERLGEILNTTLDFDELIEHVQQYLAETLRAGSVEITLQKSSSDPADPRTGREILLASREILFEPILIDEKQIGSILVGAKRSGDRYREEDAQLLRTFSLQASIAFARAQLFQEVQKHALELEEKVTKRTAQLREAHENERRMLQDIAHGLQTPLAVFKTKLETLRSSSYGATGIDMLERSLTNLSDFVVDLLKLAQLDRTTAPEFTVCSFSELVNAICDEAEVVASARGIQIMREIETGIIVRADVRELSAGIMNLLSNSLKYMRESGVQKMTIVVRREGSEAVLSIEDTGPGISPQDLPYIFDRFYRAGNSGTDGSGLGLAISKRVAERHGGILSAESIVGVGTTMIFRLPIAGRAENDA